MNSIMHERIANAAVALLPEKEQAIWSGVRKELLDASNYPDLFFGLAACRSEIFGFGKSMSIPIDA